MVTGSVALLEREVYSEAEAARLLGLAQGTLHYWLEGGQRGQKTYLPIIREDPSGSRIVTWGEFVEAALLRLYRQEKVPMVQLRLFIQTLRADLGVRYPLAHARPWRSGRDLLWRAQDVAELAPQYWLVANEQMVLSFEGQTFLQQVKWEGLDGDGIDSFAIASGFYPQPGSPVIIDPRVRFGRPSIKGVSTEAIAGEIESGASMDEAAEDFGLDVADVRAAYGFEALRTA